MRFVVQEHDARRLHYDFRLEMGGVLKSWAIPKGPSMRPAEKRLAVMVEDHSLDFLDYEGIIPEGQYGSGAVIVWDTGNYKIREGVEPEEEIEKGKIIIELYGKTLKGGFSLVKMKGRGERNWLLIKKKDKYSQTDWALSVALTEEKKRNLPEKTPHDEDTKKDEQNG